MYSKQDVASNIIIRMREQKLLNLVLKSNFYQFKDCCTLSLRQHKRRQTFIEVKSQQLMRSVGDYWAANNT